MKIRNFSIALFLAVAGINAAFAAVPLQLNLEKDKAYKVISLTEQNITQSMNGMEMEISMKNTNKICFTVISKESDFMMVKVSFDSIVNEMTMPGKSMSMSSSITGDPKSMEGAMNLALFNLSHNPLDVKISYSGKVIEISNAKAVSDKVLSAFDSLPSMMQMQSKPMMETMASAASLKSMVETLTSYLPTSDATDNWNNKLIVSASGMELSINSKYKIKEQKGNEITLTGDATIEPAGDGKMTMNGMQMNFDLRGMGTSDLTIDSTTGWIIKGKAKQKMQGSITAGGMSIPMTVSSKTEFSVVK